MLISILIFIFILVFLTLPFWLPDVLVRLRMWIFTRINGSKGLQFPNKNFDNTCFLKLYKHPNARGRSEGAELSNLFWYWLSPGAHMHQEHLEDGEHYEKIATFTKQKLTIPPEKINALLTKCFHRFPLFKSNEDKTVLRIRDFMIPLWAAFYYEIVFEEECPEQACQLIATHANDVVTAMKCCGLRHMKKRQALTHFLREKLKKTTLFSSLNEMFSLDDQVYYLQGAFFTTAVVQMSDAMSQLIMTVSKNNALQETLVSSDDRSLYIKVIYETLRMFPLFGIAHRITSEDIVLDEQVIKKGTVLCFNYENFQQLGFENPHQFQVDRWKSNTIKNANFIPFGVEQNRKCPAHSIALLTMRQLLQLLLSTYRFTSSARQTRSLVNRGPVLVVNREKYSSPQKNEKRTLLCMKLRDQWENVAVSFMQLIYGTTMLLNANKLKLANNYFAPIQSDDVYTSRQ